MLCCSAVSCLWFRCRGAGAAHGGRAGLASPADWSEAAEVGHAENLRELACFAIFNESLFSRAHLTEVALSRISFRHQASRLASSTTLLEDATKLGCHLAAAVGRPRIKRTLPRTLGILLAPKMAGGESRKLRNRVHKCFTRIRDSVSHAVLSSSRRALEE